MTAPNVSLPPSTVQYLRDAYHFQWTQCSLPYLGIQLTPSFETLYQVNHHPVFKRLQEDLRHCPTLSHLLAAWDRARHHKALFSLHTALAPIFCNPEFTPGLVPAPFQWWLNKGLLWIGDYPDGDQPYSLQYLKDKLQIPFTETFQYN